MPYRQAVVTALEGDYMWVRVDPTGCARCLQGRGCGLGFKFNRTDRSSLRILNTCGAKPHDSVTLALCDSAMLYVCAVLYGVPLGSLLVCCGLAQWLLGEAGLGEYPAIIGALVGLLGGVLLGRYWGGRLADCAAVKILPQSGL